MFRALPRLSVILFAAGCVLMHFVQPALSPLQDAVSFYMTGRLGWVLQVSLVLLGIGSVQVAFRYRGFGAALLGMWGATVILAGIFPPDPPGNWSKPPSTSGLVHGAAAIIALPSFVAGALRLSRTPLLRGLAIASTVMLVLFFASLWPVFQNHAPVLLGLTERLLLALYLAWLWAGAKL